MSAPQFTPGPWEAFHRTQGVGITGEVAADFVIPATLSAEERECVADYAVARCLTNLNGFDPIAEREANARLIAAAPELYRVLANAVAQYDAIKGGPIIGALEAARAALAKARGEQVSA